MPSLYHLLGLISSKDGGFGVVSSKDGGFGELVPGVEV